MRLTAIPFLLIALAASAAPQSSAVAKQAAVDAAGFRACFKAQAGLVPFSGVALARHGTTNFFEAAGFADPDARIQIVAQTRFRLASVQKVMTRVAIGLLVQENKVDLDSPISKYLPGLSPEFGSITVDQLLQHTSGAAPFTNLGKLTPDLRMAYARAMTSGERLAVIAAQPLSFRPGKGHEYSNGGYHVLGAIIEASGGMTYADYLHEKLFKPLGMTSTNLLPDERTAVRFTKIRMGGGIFPDWTAAVARQERLGTPAGDGVSTAEDLTRLGQALLGDALLRPAIKARIFPRKGDAWRIGQSGGTIGTNTDFSAYPDTGWIVTVLANFDPPAGELMGEVLRDYVRGKGCNPLAAKDRASPMQSITAPGGKPR